MSTHVIRIRPWRAFLAATLLLTLAALLLTGWAVTSLELPPLHIVVDGQEVASSLNLAGMPPAHKVMLVLGIVFAGVLALMVVPVVLLVAAGVALLGLLLGVGLPVLVLLALGTVLASPMVLLVLFAVWLLRRPRSIAA